MELPVVVPAQALEGGEVVSEAREVHVARGEPPTQVLYGGDSRREVRMAATLRVGGGVYLYLLCKFLAVAEHQAIVVVPHQLMQTSRQGGREGVRASTR